MKDKIKKELNILSEQKVWSEEEIQQKISEARLAKAELEKEKKSITNKIARLNAKIKQWNDMLPGQMDMFG